MGCKQGDGMYPQNTCSPYLPYTDTLFSTVYLPFTLHSPSTNFQLYQHSGSQQRWQLKREAEMCPDFWLVRHYRVLQLLKEAVAQKHNLATLPGGIPKLCFLFLQLMLYKWLQLVFCARWGYMVKDQRNSRTCVNVLAKEGTGSENKVCISEHTWVRFHLGGVQEKG